MIYVDLKEERVRFNNIDSKVNPLELADMVETARKTKGLKTDSCEGCGICCRDVIPLNNFDIIRISEYLGEKEEDFLTRYIDLPRRPEKKDREKAVLDFSRNFNLDKKQAIILYEVNQSLPVALKKKKDGACIFLNNELCGIYDQRPYACRLYNCIMGEKLDQLFENITAMGTWAAYTHIGWIKAEDISHNPFIGKASIEEVSLDSIAAIDLCEARGLLFGFF